MKLFLLSLLFSISVIDADTQVAQYGGCLNPDAGPDDRALHCHFDERHCETNEQWLIPSDVIDQGYGPCTCDTDYLTPVFLYSCYEGGVVSCVGEFSQCSSSAFDFGERYNTETDIIDGCGAGSIAEGAFTGLTCGKQCQCNYNYYNNGNIVQAGSTKYGACHSETDQFTCAIYESECEPEEIYYPFTSSFLSINGVECNCDDVTTGACVTGSDTFGYCAVSEASCASDQTFLTRNELSTSSFSTDCRLCVNTWTQPTTSPTNPPPTSSPTPCATGTGFSLQILTDAYGGETTWALRDEASGNTVASGGPYESVKLNNEFECLDDGCYEFVIFDSFGDGICCEFGNGFYTVTVDGELVAEGGDFTTSEIKKFCVGEPTCSDALLPVALDGNSVSCDIVVANNGCDSEAGRSHCPASCGACDVYGCADSLAPIVEINGNARFCRDLPGLLGDDLLEKCDLAQLSSTCRDTCGLCA